ncbi:MAG TPA: toast rack family protein [Trueperaceae bacterium]|nr:toast rack family protein [Trueperaceae bacterium]
MTQQPGTPKSTNYLPYILIVVGVLILVGNLGPGFGSVFSAIGSLLNLWPIALIAVGVDLITAGKYRTIVIGAAVVIALVFLFAAPRLGGGMAGAGERQDVNIPLDGATAVDVTIDMGVAKLRLGSSSTAADAVSGVVQPSRGERFEMDSSRRGSTLDVELRSRSTRGSFNFGVFGAVDGGTWNLNLTERVPIDLEIDAGVGSSELDLRNVQLSSFDLDAGVGSVEATLPGGNYSGSIDGGVGSITLRLPRGTPARIEVDTGLGGVSAGGEFQRSGDVYTTANYGGNGVRLSISAGVGQVRIETVP